MPNLKSAKKRVRTNLVKRTRNDIIRSKMKTFIKKTLRATEEKNKNDVQSFLKKAFSAIDRAAKRGVVHKNYANRRKSRLAKLSHPFLADSPTTPLPSSPEKKA